MHKRLIPTALNVDLKEQASGRRHKSHFWPAAARQPGAQYQRPLLMEGSSSRAAGIILTLAALTTLSAPAFAAPERTRIRGTVTLISRDTMTVHTESEDIPVTLAATTKYLLVDKSSLEAIEEGSYIGTATKTAGTTTVALEVVVFPPSMRGTGDGHYDWDKLPDTTMQGAPTTESKMTNGTVSIMPAVDTKMTNGSVDSAASKDGSKTLTVRYKGGEQTIVVPPTAPIVTLGPGTMDDVKQGSSVFIVAMKDAGSVEAGMVAVGKNGLKPPM